MYAPRNTAEELQALIAALPENRQLLAMGQTRACLIIAGFTRQLTRLGEQLGKHARLSTLLQEQENAPEHNTTLANN